ncbi:SCO1431 family membrane protein [Streptomyces beigongshangae]|uniref:SCO1431 family membrane protein n=1 Tax=Streptomyces beigongshangae TaxID=2841597 RepID=UPI001C847FF8|nr:SCO1431 family membrane protein [Streptomyces sp. REN17]
MTTISATAGRARARTGGPEDEDRGPKIFEHVMGWTFVLVLAMFVTRLGLV